MLLRILYFPSLDFTVESSWRRLSKDNGCPHSLGVTKESDPASNMAAKLPFKASPHKIKTG